VQGLLSEARQYSIAQNTFVYVSFLEKQNENQIPEIQMALIASKDGTDISEQGTQMVPLSKAILITKVAHFEGVDLKNKDAFSANQIPRPTSKNVSDINASETSSFGPLKGTNYPICFWFAPDGSVKQGEAPASRLEFAFQSKDGTGKNSVLFQIQSLTGISRAYYPL
ncbi:MAG: hypothetical protein V4507_15405, partial [Verrucomicrobiota bacterium]